VPFTKPRRENEFSPFMTHPFHHGRSFQTRTAPKTPPVQYSRHARSDISMARRRNFSWSGFGVLT